VLWPPRGEAARGLRDNDRSLVLRVELEGEGTRVLLPGDIEAAAEAALVAAGAPLAADVLKLPHHGSRTSSGAVFLARVGAALAIASAPCLGRFAMPHTEVRRGAAAAGASLWWTGRDGAVVVSLSRPLVGRGLAPAGRPRERWRCQGEDAARESRSGEGAARAPVGRRAPELPSWGAQAAADADKGTNG
jgi:competence protein ComEC